MSGPMYDFMMIYIGVCLVLTLGSIKEFRSEVKRIGYVFLLVVNRSCIAIVNYIKDCIYTERVKEDPIFNPISDVGMSNISDIELGLQMNKSAYISL